MGFEISVFEDIALTAFAVAMANLPQFLAWQRGRYDMFRASRLAPPYRTLRTVFVYAQN